MQADDEGNDEGAERGNVFTTLVGGAHLQRCFAASVCSASVLWGLASTGGLNELTAGLYFAHSLTALVKWVWFVR